MEIVKITAKEMNEKYVGCNGGYLTGAHYALYEAGKGFVSMDGKNAYILKGKYGKAALEAIIEAGGFIGKVAYAKAI